MKIAFDCQGVLISDGETPEVLRSRPRGIIMPYLAEMLMRASGEVYCISAAPEGHPTSAEALLNLMAWNAIPLHGVLIAWHKPNESKFEIGCRKAEIMIAHEIPVIFDDLEEVCEGIRSRGRIAIRYTTNWERA